MGASCGTVETTICSWKLDEKGILRKAITWASIRFNPFMIFIPTLISTLGGPVIRVQQSLTSSGGFIELYFAGKDYTGSGNFMAARDLFSDIKRMTSAEWVELLPIS